MAMIGDNAAQISQDDIIDPNSLPNDSSSANTTEGLGSIDLNHQKMVVQRAPTQAQHVATPLANVVDQQSSPSTSGKSTLTNSKVKRNEYSQIEWPISNSKLAKPLLRGIALVVVSTLIGFATGGPVGAVIGGLSSSLITAAALCKHFNRPEPSIVRRIADQAVSQHIRDPANFQTMSVTERTGNELAFLHVRAAVALALTSWGYAKIENGEKFTDEEAQDYANTCAKQLADRMTAGDWNKLAGMKDSKRSTINQLKELARTGSVASNAVHTGNSSLFGGLSDVDPQRARNNSIFSDAGDIHGSPPIENSLISE